MSISARSTFVPRAREPKRYIFASGISAEITAIIFCFIFSSNFFIQSSYDLYNYNVSSIPRGYLLSRNMLKYGLSYLLAFIAKCTIIMPDSSNCKQSLRSESIMHKYKYIIGTFHTHLYSLWLSSCEQIQSLQLT